MDRLEAMRVFVAVAEARGFAAAARKLAMSPPAVTRAVAAVEQRIGAQLLRRNTRVVRLTDAGARYLADCKRILADLEDAEANAAGSQRELRGSVAVTAPVMFGRLFVAPVLLDFLALHTELRARMLLLDRVVDLVEEGMDVAVRIANLDERSSEFAHRVGAVRRVACASPAYLAQHGVPEVPRDLERHRAIVFSHGATHVDWSFRVDGKPQVIRPSTALSVNSTELTVMAAAAGRGVTFALSYQVAREVQNGELVVLLEAFEPPPVPIHVVHRDGRRASARVRAFVDFAVEKLRAATSIELTPRPPERRGR